MKRGLDRGFKPELTLEGTGGTYFLQDAARQKVAVFKPQDEEPFAPNNPRCVGVCVCFFLDNTCVFFLCRGVCVEVGPLLLQLVQLHSLNSLETVGVLLRLL